MSLQPQSVYEWITVFKTGRITDKERQEHLSTFATEENIERVRRKTIDKGRVNIDEALMHSKF